MIAMASRDLLQKSLFHVEVVKDKRGKGCFRVVVLVSWLRQIGLPGLLPQMLPAKTSSKEHHISELKR
jgi:hypothetical protein